MLIAFSLNATAQQTRIIPMNGGSGIFRTNVAKNTLILDVENNSLYKLNTYTTAGSALINANKTSIIGDVNVLPRDSVTVNGSIDTVTLNLDYGAKNLIINAGTIINGTVTNTKVDSSVTIINGGGFAVQDELRILTPLSYDATKFSFDTLNFADNTFLSYEIDIMCIADNAGSFMLFRSIYKLDVIFENGVKSYMFSELEYPTRTDTNMQITLFTPVPERLILQISGMPAAVTSCKALMQITEREVSL